MSTFLFLWVLGIVALCLGFNWSQRRRLQAECRAAGHSWHVSYTPDGDQRLQCDRCGHIF